jgi:hypothetical protein
MVKYRNFKIYKSKCCIPKKWFEHPVNLKVKEYTTEEFDKLFLYVIKAINKYNNKFKIIKSFYEKLGLEI